MHTIVGPVSVGRFVGQKIIEGLGKGLFNSNKQDVAKLVLKGTDKLVSSDKITSLVTIGGVIGLTALVPKIMPALIGAEVFHVVMNKALGKEVNLVQDFKNVLQMGNKVTRGIIGRTVVPLLNSINKDKAIQQEQAQSNEQVDRF